MGNKPGGYDLIQDENIEKAYQWDKFGDSVTPRPDRQAVLIPGQSVVPIDPPTDAVKMYVIVSGISPNKLIKFAYKNANGQEIVFNTMVV